MMNEQILNELHQNRERSILVRIIALDLNENPIEYIEGRTTGGSGNIDGTSVIRRTCQLTLVGEPQKITEYYWTLNQKFKLEIGIETPDEIIWFKQGVYVITSFNASVSVNSCTISISGKDKMCLLNGENGGVINSSADFGTIEETDPEGNIEIRKLPINEIIKEIVHVYGGEPYHNIIINDLPEKGLELLEYRFDIPMYLFRSVGSQDYANGTLVGDTKVYYKVGGQWRGPKALDALSKEEDIADNINYEPLGVFRLGISRLGSPFGLVIFDPLYGGGNDETLTEFSAEENGSNPFYIAKIQYGDTAGYRETDLVYAGELIANTGESVTSILDKIKNMLVDFEYFYNLDGQFIFQKKKTTLNTAWSPLKEAEGGEVYVDPTSKPTSYVFNNSELFTNFNNTPDIANIKNDFTVWGAKGANNVPIHMRYALDTKPIQYTTIQVSDAELESYNQKYDFNLRGQRSRTFYYGPNSPYTEDISNSEGLIGAENGVLNFNLEGSLFENLIKEPIDGKPTFNSEYISYDEKTKSLVITLTPGDTVVDWRELIYRMALDYRRYNHLDDFEQRVAAANPDFFPTGKTGYEQYYMDLEGFWRLIYNPAPYVNAYINSKAEYDEAPPGSLYTKVLNSYIESSSYDSSETYYKWDENFYPKSNLFYPWNRLVDEQPQELIFWFDFLDTQGEISRFNVKAIGSRPKAISESKAKAIAYKETPNIIFYQDDSEQKQPGYKYFKYPKEYENMFSISAQGLSVKDKIDELVYKHALCTESVSFISVPIYNLEPNTRAYINDLETGINGEYFISRITMPLTYNGTMNVTATKAINKLY